MTYNISLLLEVKEDWYYLIKNMQFQLLSETSPRRISCQRKGDIGGKKTLFCIISDDGGQVRPWMSSQSSRQDECPEKNHVHGLKCSTYNSFLLEEFFFNWQAETSINVHIFKARIAIFCLLVKCTLTVHFSSRFCFSFLKVSKT